MLKDGTQTLTANIPMGGFKLTGLAAGSATGNSLRYEQLFVASALALLGTLDISTAAGGQIVFPATQNASSGANTLDDYEEQTWTPVVTFATPGNLSIAYLQQLGLYTKIGRLVMVECIIQTSTFTHTTASGNLKITGFPFSNNATTEGIGATVWSGITKANYTNICTRLLGSGAIAELWASGSAQAELPVTAADTPSAGTLVIRFCMSYTV
ncbi:MAG: hypothetical protein Q7J84_00035 [Sulfuricaulis sp.]|nr:hypothetical protein [Sulfuricaulis sp.]